MPYQLTLETPIQYVPRIGPSYAAKLAKLGINTVEDLLWYFPFRYDNFQITSTISSVRAGETITVKGTVLSSSNVFTKNGKKLTMVKFADESGMIDAVWFNQFYLKNNFKTDSVWQLSGKVDWFGNKVVFVAPQYEQITDNSKQLTDNTKQITLENVHTGRLVPVYSETSGISSKVLRNRLAYLFNNGFRELAEYLPEEIIKNNDLENISQAISEIHFPSGQTDVTRAKKRLAFDELFFLQLAAQIRKKRWQTERKGIPLNIDQEKILLFLSKLPFTLTNAQGRVTKEILSDLQKSIPENRLLEGDVGSGKTVVAAIAMYMAYLNGYQSALMAPTEILAQQHFQTISTLLSSLGVKINLLTSSTKKADDNSFDILIGTHSLLYDKAKFTKLALVVIDEQHRFGVEQRAVLWGKGKNPHLLTMTATPIPRTIALAVYGDMDLSYLDEMPIGRQKIKTWVVPNEKRASANAWLKKQLKENSDQCFIICPLIEESENLQTIKAAKAEFDHIKEIFPDFRIGLLHGKLKSTEKTNVINQFREHKLDILVSTPVVEVGIDIANATVMFIEGADRFGLAQLHQLRGRVGRGDKQSYCFLFTENDKKEALARLKTMEKYQIGEKLAEEDLKLRGPGELFGVKQHGFGTLKIATFSDFKLMAQAKKEAETVVSKDQTLTSYPLLQKKVEKFLSLETKTQIA